jgi:hypothetical protein
MTRETLRAAAANTPQYNLASENLDLNIVRADQLLLSSPPSRSWLLDQVLEVKKTGLIIGSGGTGKSDLPPITRPMLKLEFVFN